MRKLDWVKVTGVFMALAFGVIAGYDVLAYMRGGYEATISCQWLAASTERQILAFGPGFVCGHLFRPRVKGSPWLPHVLRACVVWAAAGALAYFGEPVTFVAFLAGAPFGGLFWAQPPTKDSPAKPQGTVVG